DCHRTLWNALYLSCFLTPPLMGLVLAFVPFFPYFGLSHPLIAQTVPFLKALVWSTFPLVVYFVTRRYLQSMGIVKPVVHVRFANLHGTGAGRRVGLLRLQAEERLVGSFAQRGRRQDSSDPAPGFPGCVAAPVRDWWVRVCDVPDRRTGCCAACRPPDCNQRGEFHVHGSSRHQFGRGDPRGAGRRRRRRTRRCARRLDSPAF